jgi:uncharacterized protein YdhG (YjbR/CyaY superfamily)
MGKLAQIKTRETKASIEDFINSIEDEKKRKDSIVILGLMPASGREVDWFKIGFSPRKTHISLYGLNIKKHAEALKKFGKHKTGVGCLYINKLVDIDVKLLEEMINEAAKAK